MGLDVTAYGRLRKADRQEPEAEYDLPCAVRIYVEPSFRERCQDLEDRVVYECATECEGPSMAYSFYNRWRDRLAQIAGYGSAADVWNNKATTGRFVELIDFSDCEGCIGPTVCRKLAQDFGAFQQSVDLLPATIENDRFKEIYRKFRRAFELASNGGCVKFH